MNKDTRYFFSTHTQASADLHVDSLSIHERMLPGRIVHGGPGSPFLVMYFHSPATVQSCSEEVEAQHGFIVWDRDQHHNYGNGLTAWDHSWMNIRGDRFARTLETERIPLNRVLFCGSEGVVTKYLLLLYEELQAWGHQDRDQLLGILSLFCHELARALTHGSAPDAIPSRLLEVRQHIENNLRHPFTLEELAELARLSVSQFSMLFSKHFGISPVRYISQLRLERASRLLLDRNFTIKEVAFMVGFGDPLYFSRQFRARFGVSPRAYRQRYQ